MHHDPVPDLIIALVIMEDSNLVNDTILMVVINLNLVVVKIIGAIYFKDYNFGIRAIRVNFSIVLLKITDHDNFYVD